MPDLETPPVSFEDYPLTRAEYISAMIHFYRGEISRADAWRARLDPTTNWAVVTTGGMLSFAFSQPAHSHVTLLLANFLIVIFLCFEARRFRYFDVWRSRVRMIEENFFIPIIRRNLVSPRVDWHKFVADDLDHPTFKTTFFQAVGIRLRYNFIWIFLVVLIAWLAKLSLHPTASTGIGDLVQRARIGPLPGGAVVAMVGAFYAAAITLAAWAGGPKARGDEIHGLETAMEHWKT